MSALPVTAPTVAPELQESGTPPRTAGCCCPAGPRVMTNIVDVDPFQLAVDLPVTVVFADNGEGTAILRFARPV